MRETTNLYDETIEILEHNGIDMSTGENPKIERVFAPSWGWFWWDEFAKIAKITNYYPGHGSPKIATDLVVLGDDFWLERDEYDGAEWWKFKRMPKSAAGHLKPCALGGHMGYKTLREIHESLDDEGNPIY